MAKKSIRQTIFDCFNELNKKAVPMDVTKILRQNGAYMGDSYKKDSAVVSDNLWHLWKEGKIEKEGDYYIPLNFNENVEMNADVQDPIDTTNSYHERDLHPILVSYLESKGIYSKTIYHEKSEMTDKSQTWVHPDIIGVKFAKFKKDSTKDLMSNTNIEESYDLYSFELKRNIDTDNNLKKYYFQALSNSSWANFGYLVAFEINMDRMEEMARLNSLFGIGVIQLSSNIEEIKVVYPATRRQLDFRSMDKLSEINKEFDDFISQVSGLISEKDSKKYHTLENHLIEITCDDVKSAEDLQEYCKKHNIPI